MRKVNIYDKNNEGAPIMKRVNPVPLNEEDPLEREKANIKREVLRSFLRIEQCREEPIDKFVKIVWILKGRLPYDPSIHEIMSEPKKYIAQLSIAELNKTFNLAQDHCKFEQFEESRFEKYWKSLIGLIEHFQKKSTEKVKNLEPEYEERIK